jgi:acetyl esterase
MPLHPAMQAMVDARKAAGIQPFHAMGVEGARQMSDAVANILPSGPDMLRVEDIKISGADGALPARLYVPVDNPAALIIFYHGGGWVLGSIAGYDSVCRRLASVSGCAVLSVEYRLAPEHVFPAAADDSYAAACWAEANCKALMGAQLPIVVAGDSAGGNLAAVVCLMARDRQCPPIALQCLIFPVTDFDPERPSYNIFSEGGLLTSEAMLWFWDQYIPDHDQRTDVHASPLRAANLAGLPPAIIELAGHDPLLDEGKAYADALAAAGVPTKVRCHDELSHGYFQLSGLLPPAQDAVDELAKTLRQCLLS